MTQATHYMTDKEVSSAAALRDQESGHTDSSSSPFGDPTVSEVDGYVYKAKAGSTRTSRAISWFIGVSVLAGAVVGVVFFVDRKGYGRSEAQHENYQGLVSVSMLEQHNDPDTDCWMELHGSVYDLTDYAPRHPGGAEYVTDYCGMNATKWYDKEHPTRYLPTIKRYNLGAAVTDQEYATLTRQSGGSSSAAVPPTSAANSDFSDSSEGDDNDASEDSSSFTGNPTPRPPATTTAATTAQTSSTTAASATLPADGMDPANTTTTTPTTTTTATTTVTQTGCPVQYYSTAEVALHNVVEDCWYILYNRIYDFTDYIDEHPGGRRQVFEHCGTDATIPYEVEKKHDLALLDKKTPELWIGMWGVDVTEVRYEPCAEE